MKRRIVIVLAALSAIVALPAVFILVALILGDKLDPGPTNILDGYYHTFGDPSGGVSRIVYKGEKSDDRWTIVIDDRVDQYRAVGTQIFVARLPITSRSKLDPFNMAFGQCEYWVIDVVKHSVSKAVKTTEWEDTDCAPGI